MDSVVQQAMAKWPKVPHCYGWLALDARGNFRMRDEHAQAHGLPGEKLRHEALLGFIYRNYEKDERGCWYFQNGPQRVFVNLEAAPYIARTQSQGALVLHTGAALDRLEQVWLSDGGQLWMAAGGVHAMLDDRDLERCLAWMTMNGSPVTDDKLMAWLEGRPGAGSLKFNYGDVSVEVGRIDQADAPQRFGFVRQPHP